MIKGLSEEKLAEIKAFVKERWDELYSKKQLLDEKALEWLADYHSIPRGGKESWESDIFVPYGFSQVATIKPRLKSSLFQYNDFLQVKAQHPDYVSSEKAIQNFIISNFEEMGFRHKIGDAIHDGLPYGTGWVKVTMGTKNQIRMSVLDFFDVIADFSQRANTSNDFTDCFHRIETNINALRLQEKEEVYMNIDEVEGSDFPVDEILDNQIKIQGYSVGVDGLAVDTKKYKSNKLNKVELLEYWGWYDVNDDGQDEMLVITLANREHIIRIDLNKEGQIPIFPIRAYRIPRITYGKSFMQLIEGLQFELNTKRNQFIDVLNLILKPWFKARRNAEIDWNNLFGTPNNVIRMDDPATDVVPFEMKAPPSYMAGAESMVKNDIQYTLGATDFNMGVSTGRGYTETATGVSIITSESATRFRDYLDDLNFDVMPVANYALMLMKKYKKDYRKLRMFDSQDWTKITPMMLKQNYKLKFNLAPFVQNKELRMQVLMNLVNTVGQVMDIKPIIREILELAEAREIDKISGNIKEIEKKNIAQVGTGRTAREEELTQDIGMSRPINAILQNQAGLSPLNPQARQTVRNPIMDLIRSMGGKV